MLYDHNASTFVLGCLMNNPALLLNEKYTLTKDDFYNKATKEGNRFHSIIFVCSQKLIEQGANDITEIEIREFVKNYPEQLEVLEDNDYQGYIKTAKKLSNQDNFEIYYQIVRKFSILRAYKNQGFDINEIYDEEEDDEAERRKLNNYSIEDIINYFDGKLANISKKFNTSKRLDEYRAGSDFAETKEQFKTEPLIGSSFQSPYLNSIFRGMYGFILRSGNSGSGKTTMSVGDICKMSCTQYWDSEQKQWVKNLSRAGASLFINSEMSLREELEPIFIAWIANVSRSHILDGKYEDGEEERCDKAGRILYESEIYLVDDPDFTISSLTSIIEDYALNKNVKNVCFDYISSNTFLQQEVSSKTKVPQREDMILLALTDRLKQVSRKLSVNILSGTQLNAQDREVKYVTESLLMGGKGQVRKVDGCMIMTTPTQSELELTTMLCNKKGFNNIKPNFVAHIVKGRASKYPKNIKVFQYVDLATARTIDLYCTDKDNNPIKVERLMIENTENR